VVASGSEDKTIMLWDVKTRRPLNSLVGQSAAITCLVFDTHGPALFSGDSDGNIIRWQGFSYLGETIFWDSDTVKPAETSVKHLNAPISAIFLSRDGRRISLARQRNEAAGQLLLTNSRDDPPLGRRVAAPDAKYANLAFSPDGRRLASSGDFYNVVEWDVANRTTIGEPLSGHEQHVASLAYSPDGKTLISGDYGGRIIFWSVNAHNLMGPPVQHRDSPVWSLVWSLDGKTVVSGEDGGIVFWDAGSRRQLEYRIMPDRIWSLAFSPDGKSLVSAGNSLVVTIWKVGNGTHPSRTFGSPRPKDNAWELTPAGLSFTPDGELLASSSLDDSVTIRNFRSGQPVMPVLSGHMGSVSSLAFSHDGKILASASDESEIRLWDVETHEPIGALFALQQDKTIRSVEFSPTSGILASNGEDDAIIFWDVDYKAWAERACAIVNRNLTESEWNTYMENRPYRRTCPNNR
jgi:WD40 repeat protein